MSALASHVLIPLILLAHPDAVPHAHPHGLDAATLLAVGGMLVLLGLARRTWRRER